MLMTRMGEDIRMKFEHPHITRDFVQRWPGVPLSGNSPGIQEESLRNTREKHLAMLVWLGQHSVSDRSHTHLPSVLGSSGKNKS